ncbi:MAG: heme biosynthesis protein HemY [Hyphomonas sp.]|uniref:heme biosynthesis protein HemY n=1 Tax=Hyphomonas sp. TaxID=87 RepID=UPI0017C5EC6E|nr:heme biosynthesis HemY N-terminal domain-containing protein [Hyphomonas sp.]MBU3920791.1 heme biosynthesis protein HemY [Alphaproteobacteria bacterium]MBA3068744.1 heme biosynthesis protein HemY [Hyphomonas sp.]MBU4063592.1 heme biosynthesis protein HemY [Alphaproteobacteria bacterium]MBU4165783.1 heme biosynthesis protein HemY [Alphaproteobacteria bacterium]MBU4568598.1 heme biosynthesis protein HemY [Alphaproteobacteria bacterium]
MSRFFLFLIVIILVMVGAALSWWAFSLPGEVTFPVGQEIVAVKSGVAAIFVVLLGGLIALVWWLATGILVLPGRISKARRLSQTRKANAALAEGLLAAEGGDAKAALKLARRAMRHAEDERLKLLLEARAAEANDDWAGAERAWGLLTRLPGGQLAGLRGAATAASERGDQLTAETRAREALALKSDADWPFNSLFDLQVSKGDWDKALETLAQGEKRGQIEALNAKRRRAVLHTAKAVSLPHTEKQAAQKALAEAIRSAPDFPPGAYHGARFLMTDGKTKAAQGVLELGWKARPHPALAQLSRRLIPQDIRQNIAARLKGLVDAHPGHRESRILTAENAMDSADWVGAIRILALLVEENPTARLCLLMERALKGYGDPVEAQRWGRMAASASREADWSDIDPKGNAFDFDRAAWGRLVYAFGDVGDLVHPRYETYGRELEAGRVLALPLADESPLAPPKAPQGPLTQPLDYAPDED